MSLYKGVRIAKGHGILTVKGADSNLLDTSIADNEIITVALEEQQRNPQRKVILVSRDINMRVICDSIGLETEDYTNNQIVKDSESIFTGCATHLVDDRIIERFFFIFSKLVF